MIADVEDQVISTFQAIFDRFGWLGVAGLLAFENATGISHNEVILAMKDWMLFAALGSAMGSAVTYWVARPGGRSAVDRMARWIRIEPRHFQSTKALFKRRGPGLILFGRVVPGARTNHHPSWFGTRAISPIPGTYFRRSLLYWVRYNHWAWFCYWQ